jgi:putative flippase GtrA
MRSLTDQVFVAKFWKYCMTSVTGTFITQSSLYVFASILDWPGLTANIVAVVLGTIPTYWMSRAWVWSKTGKSSFRTEVLPFWVLTFLGLALSSLFVVVFEHVWPDNKLLINVGNVAGFGVLWLAKFFIIDRMVFTPDEPMVL